MAESGQQRGARGPGPAGGGRHSLPGRRCSQSSLPQSDREVPEAAGCEGGPGLPLQALGHTGTQDTCSLPRKEIWRVSSLFCGVNVEAMRHNQLHSARTSDVQGILYSNMKLKSHNSATDSFQVKRLFF